MEQTGDLKHEALSIYQLSDESTNRRRYESPDGAGVAKLLGSLGLGEFLNTSSTGFFDAPYGYMYHQPGASRRFLSSLGSTCSRVVCQTEKKKICLQTMQCTWLEPQSAVVTGKVGRSMHLHRPLHEILSNRMEFDVVESSMTTKQANFHVNRLYPRLHRTCNDHPKPALLPGGIVTKYKRVSSL